MRIVGSLSSVAGFGVKMVADMRVPSLQMSAARASMLSGTEKLSGPSCCARASDDESQSSVASNARVMTEKRTSFPQRLQVAARIAARSESECAPDDFLHGIAQRYLRDGCPHPVLPPHAGEETIR